MNPAGPRGGDRSAGPGAAGRVVGVDVGGTHVRAAVFDGGHRVTGVERSVGRTFVEGDGVSALLPELRDVLSELDSGPVDAVCIGIAGLGQRSTAAPRITAALRETLPTATAVVTSDMVCCHAGALGHASGVVVAAGTGAVALAVDDNGRYARADGWGYLLGDDGSGFAIGRAGLAAALRAVDGRGGSEELWRRAARRYGGREEIVGAIYGSGSPPRTIAAFAPDVAAAARVGDPQAASVWADAALQLARTAAGAAGQLFDAGAAVRVSYSGSVFDVRDLLLEPFAAALAGLLPSALLSAPRGDALEGCRLLALRRGGLYDHLLHRSGPDPDHPVAP